MSLETLAGLTGRSKGWLSKIENGHARLERRQDIAAIAEALEVSADGLLGEPAPGIRLDGRMYNLKPLQSALLDLSPHDRSRYPRSPVAVLRDEVELADLSLRAADHATVIRLLKLLVRAYGSDGTCALRQIGETNLASIAGKRAWQAANVLTGAPSGRSPLLEIGVRSG